MLSNSDQNSVVPLEEEILLLYLSHNVKGLFSISVYSVLMLLL